ncbi:MAG: hypothetical protein LBQ48_02070 [Oscillospiraceae bacterium]|nr:hypothetical protein [Oscillospiraceae bacterium]
MTEKEKLQVDKILEESRKRRLASAKLLSQMGGQGNLAPPGGFMRPQPQVFDLRTQELQQSESKPQKPQPIVSDLNQITPW